MQPADVAARLQALDISRSFAVAAPAGSGKTGLLTQRVLKLLAQVDYPEEILCLTFTRKAAGEMRQRIIEALQQATQPTLASSAYEEQTRQLAREALARDSANGWQLLKSPNRLRIQTIDSCCRHLAAQLTGNDNLEPVEIPYPLYVEAVRESLLQDLERNGPVGDAIEAILRHLDNDLNKLEQLLISLLQNRDQWLGHLLYAGNARDYLEGFLEQLIAETLSRATNMLQAVESELAMLADYAASNLALRRKDSPLKHCLGLTTLPAISPAAILQWQGLVHLLLTNSDEWRKDGGIDIRLGFPIAKDDPEFGDVRKQQLQEMLSWCRNHPQLRETLLDIRYLPPAAYSDNQWQILAALAILLPRVAAQLSLVFQTRGRCDFTEIASAALQALGDDDAPTDLALRLDYQLKHILVDEFQDTSSLQFELLRRLTRGWSPADGRSLFIVGDGMQSLYSFRNANVGLFLQARAEGLGDIQLEPLDLTVNFRSQAGMIHWVNEVFRTAFPARNNINRGAVRYSDAVAIRPELDEPVSLDIFSDHADPVQNYLAEADCIAQLVSRAKARDPDGTIAILVRNRSHLNLIIKALLAAGHNWQAQDIEPLGRQMSVVDLLSLTKALCNPADRIAWLAILRAPWCGLDLRDLYWLVNDQSADNTMPSVSLQRRLPLTQLQHYQQIPGLSPQGRAILDRVAPLLCDAWQQRKRKSLRIAVEGLWVALGGNICAEKEYKLNSCIDFLKLLDKYEIGGEISDWTAFNLAVEQLYAAPRDSGDPRLQIMTIHKAKGLEFDTVIMPCLNRAGANDTNELLLWREGIGAHGQPQLFIGPIAETGAEQDALYNHLKRERSLKNHLENSRVFYVGATRAIKHLHLTLCLDSNKKPATNSLLNCIWPWLESRLDHPEPGMRITVHSGNHKAPATTPPVPVNLLKRLPANWRPTPLPRAQNTSDNASPINWESDSPQQRYTGVVLHRILEAAVRQHQCQAELLLAQQSFWRQQLKQLGTADLDLAMNYLRRAVNNLCSDRKNLWLFDHTLTDSACELALGYLDASGKVRTAIVDRTFILDDRRWIIDYKLAEPTASESLEDFLAIQRQRYLPQLRHYAELFSTREQRETVLALYFPLLPQLEILTVRPQ